MCVPVVLPTRRGGWAKLRAGWMDHCFFFSYFRFSWMVHARLARSLRMSLSAIQFSFFGVLASD